MPGSGSCFQRCSSVRSPKPLQISELFLVLLVILQDRTASSSPKPTWTLFYSILSCSRGEELLTSWLPGSRERKDVGALTGSPFIPSWSPASGMMVPHILFESLQTLSETDSEVCFTNSPSSSQAAALTLPSCTPPWDFSPYSAPFPDALGLFLLSPASCIPQCKTSLWAGSLMMPNQTGHVHVWLCSTATF